jgi:hypothetical protein
MLSSQHEVAVERNILAPCEQLDKRRTVEFAITGEALNQMAHFSSHSLQVPNKFITHVLV